MSSEDSDNEDMVTKGEARTMATDAAKEAVEGLRTEQAKSAERNTAQQAMYGAMANRLAETHPEAAQNAGVRAQVLSRAQQNIVSVPNAAALSQTDFDAALLKATDDAVVQVREGAASASSALAEKKSDAKKDGGADVAKDASDSTADKKLDQMGKSGEGPGGGGGAGSTGDGAVLTNEAVQKLFETEDALEIAVPDDRTGASMPYPSIAALEKHQHQMATEVAAKIDAGEM